MRLVKTMFKRLDREQAGLLFGLPILIALILGGWAIWHANADLDAIERPQLEWSVIRELTWQHIKMTAVAAFFVLITAIPLGILLTRPKFRKFSGPVVAFGNAGQATPIVGLIFVLALWLGFSFRVAVLALAIYGFLPVLRNTIVGLQSVDPSLVEAARGMGMSNLSTLGRLEIPLAAPIIMSGVRTALVLLAGSASFGTFVNAGGLGTLIDVGIRLFRYPVLVSGALLIAVLALVVDWLGRILEAILTPKGM